MADIVWNTTRERAQRYLPPPDRSLTDRRYGCFVVDRRSFCEYHARSMSICDQARLPELVWVPLTEPANIGDRLLATVPCELCADQGQNPLAHRDACTGSVVVWSMDIKHRHPVLMRHQRGWHVYISPANRAWLVDETERQKRISDDATGDGWVESVCAVSGPIKEEQ